MIFDYEGKALEKGDVYKTLCRHYNGGADMDIQLINSIEQIAKGEKFTLYTFDGLDGYFEFQLYSSGQWRVKED